jgi:hypothetical protein
MPATERYTRRDTLVRPVAAFSLADTWHTESPGTNRITQPSGPEPAGQDDRFRTATAVCARTKTATALRRGPIAALAFPIKKLLAAGAC